MATLWLRWWSLGHARLYLMLGLSPDKAGSIRAPGHNLARLGQCDTCSKAYRIPCRIDGAFSSLGELHENFSGIGRAFCRGICDSLFHTTVGSRGGSGTQTG